jgi:hypothetical protein
VNFSFGSPFFLVGLVAALAPMVLYLIFRLQRRSVQWGASYVLRKTIQQNVRENRWRQYVVLALRTLLLALIALVFCIPLLRGLPAPQNEFPRGGAGSLTRVILLDNSRSMRADYETGDRYAEALRLSRRLLGRMEGGDAFAVIPLAGSHVPLTFRAGEGRRGIRGRLDDIPISSEPADFTGALDAAHRQFLAAVTDHRQLVVLSDFSARDFRQTTSLEPFSGALEKLGVRCYLHRISRPDDSNVAVGPARFGTDLPLAGRPYNLYVGVTNYGEWPVAGNQLVVRAGEVVLARADYELAPNERRSVRIPLSLAAGPQRLEVRTGEDVYAPDNRVPLALTVRSRLNVLLLTSADGGAGEFQSDTEFLLRAMESFGREKPARLKLQRRDHTSVGSTDFRNTDVVILPGLRGISNELVLHLRGYLRRGGGIMVNLPIGDPGNYSYLLRELFGLSVGERYSAKVDHERHLFVQRSLVEADLLREFSTDLNADPGRARIYNYWRLNARQDARSTALLRLSSGDPLLVRARCGRGVALLWTSTLGGKWNSLVVRQAFLPLLHRMLDLAASAGRPPRNLPPGQPIICIVPHEGQLFMMTPAKDLVPLNRTQVRDQAYVRYEETRKSGVYVLTDQQGNELQSFTVTGSGHESDLRGLDPRKARNLADQFDTQFTAEESELRRSMAGTGYSLDLTSLAALTAVCVLLVEGVLLKIWF